MSPVPPPINPSQLEPALSRGKTDGAAEPGSCLCARALVIYIPRQPGGASHTVPCKTDAISDLGQECGGFGVTLQGDM